LDNLEREVRISAFFGDEIDIHGIIEKGCYVNDMDGSLLVWMQ